MSFVVLCLSWIACAEQSSVRPPWNGSKLVGTPLPPAPYRLESAYPQLRFELPTSIEQFPDAERLLITEMSGRILSFAKDRGETQANLVGDLRELLPQDVANRRVSLFDAEFHPRYAENRHLFVCYVHPGQGGHTRVSRLTLTDGPAPRLVPDSEQVLITWPSGGHNAGCLEFGRDGMLYIATGDGAGPNPPDGLTTGQDLSDLLGSILRIDVDAAAGGLRYRIPADNPFVNRSPMRAEIWAYGLRNPWKFGTDMETGELFVADNGWESWEMIHRVVRGGNCGWPVMEGRAMLRSEVPVGPTPIIPPVMDHSHTEANSVIGGPVYRGTKLPDLKGSFVYGDYITGTIWALRGESDGAYSSRTLLDTDQRIVGFTQGSRGELYVLDYDFTGQIYELLPAIRRDESANFPRRLSETGLFSSLEKLEPAPGVEPYEPIVPRWQDGAQARRWVAIPGEGRIRLATGTSTAADYPNGTVLVKHLELPRDGDRPAVRLETQILHWEDGVWNPYSYLWDSEGRDAELAPPQGASRVLELDDPSASRTWQVNATNECKLCHNAGPRFVLGFVTSQLRRERQLEALVARGVLALPPGDAASESVTLVDPHDAAQNLDDRARSYLHANCAMCHHPGGNAIVSFFLRRDLPFSELKTNKGTGIGTFGMREAKIIAPGDPYRSVLMYRMAKLGYARMPYIGSRVVDRRGVALMEDWIRSLPADTSGTASDPTQPDSGESRSLKILTRPATPADQRTVATRVLVQSTEGALALVAALHRGLLPAEATRAAIAAGQAASSDVRGLFDTFLPESQRRATLGNATDPGLITSRTGNVERGRLIYHSDAARCRACHDPQDRNMSLGPTMREINKKYPQSAELIRHVLQPSLKIEEPYVAYQVVTEDGRVINGLLVEQNAEAVTVRTLDKKNVRLPRSEIAEQQRSPRSLMPEMVLGDLTAQEAADLVEYIRSLGSD